MEDVNEMLNKIYCFKCDKEFTIRKWKNIIGFHKCPECGGYLCVVPVDIVIWINGWIISLLIMLPGVIIFIFKK